MATDPPAPDLGAIRANLEVFLGQLVTWREMETGWIRALLAAYDEREARLAALGPVLRAYREQHDICAADPDDGFDRCPCEICDAAVAAGAVGAGEESDGA